MASFRESLSAGALLGSAYRLILPRDSMRGRSGGRLGLSAGSSLDFHDYREYHPGDDLRHLDWGVYARSDKEIVKLFREEVAPKLDLVLDASASMRLDGTRKEEAALALSAAIAAAALNASCSPALWLAGRSVRRVGGSPDGSLEGWRIDGFGDPCPPAEGLLASAPAFRPNGIRVFVSDLLWPDDPSRTLSRLADGASALFVVQLLAASEEAPPERGQFRLDDVETGETLDVFVDGSAADAYRASLAAHRERWSRACSSVGATFATLTDAAVAPGLRLLALERCGLLEVL